MNTQILKKKNFLELDCFAFSKFWAKNCDYELKMTNIIWQEYELDW